MGRDPRWGSFWGHDLKRARNQYENVFLLKWVVVFTFNELFTIPVNIFHAVDAAAAGEGNLEITISARGRNIPTKVHPQGSARFTVSFLPLEAIDHVVSITFNKVRPVLEESPGKKEVPAAVARRRQCSSKPPTNFGRHIVVYCSRSRVNTRFGCIST